MKQRQAFLYFFFLLPLKPLTEPWPKQIAGGTLGKKQKQIDIKETFT